MKRSNRRWAGLVWVVCVATQFLSAYRDIASSVLEITEMVARADEMPGEVEPSIGLGAPERKPFQQASGGEERSGTYAPVGNLLAESVGDAEYGVSCRVAESRLAPETQADG